MGRLAVMAGVAALGAAGVAIGGAADPFPARVQASAGSEQATLVLTGSAMRRIYGFSVYAIGSYVKEGTRVRAADELARVDVPKQLRLVFQRDVDGDDMAESFQGSLKLNDPPGTFPRELAALTQFFRKQSVRKGDQIWLTYLPGSGLRCQLGGRGEVVIPGVAFSRAVWKVYLGPNNLGVAIKTGLVSRL